MVVVDPGDQVATRRYLTAAQHHRSIQQTAAACAIGQRAHAAAAHTAERRNAAQRAAARPVPGAAAGRAPGATRPGSAAL